MTRIDTPELVLRIRLRALPPPGEFDEYTLSHFRAGGLYTVPSRLAWLLVLAGYAELADNHSAQPEGAARGGERPAPDIGSQRAEAADFGHRRRRKKRI